MRENPSANGYGLTSTGRKGRTRQTSPYVWRGVMELFPDMGLQETKMRALSRTLRVRKTGAGYFEVRDDNGLLIGTAPTEAKGLVSAAVCADLLGEKGYHVQVLVKRDEDFMEVYAVIPVNHGPRGA